MYSGPSIEELRSRANEEYSVSTRKRGIIAVVAGMIGNITVCVVKFLAAFISGSSAMLSEAIHSVVDSCDGVFMLLGLHRANRKPDFLHPFGYGKELYFWTMVVALLVFFMGGGMSLVKGVQSIQETMAGTHALGDTTLNFIVIVAGMVIEGITLGIGIKQFNAARGDVGPVKFIRDAKDPSLYTVVLEDSAAELGLSFALISTIVCDVTGNLYFDGVASILIGILLCFVAIILLRETKGLLVGEGMKHQSLDELRDIVEADDRVISCGRILTMYMGPEDLLIAIDATFKTELSAHEVLLTVDDLERRLHARWPQAHSVFIEAESMRSVLRQKLVEDNWEDEYEDEYEDEVEEEFEEREQERLEQKLTEDEDLLKTFESIQSDEEKAQRSGQEAGGGEGAERTEHAER